MNNNVERLAKQARETFGEVMAIRPKSSPNEYYVFIKRDNAPMTDRPYMYITGFVNSRNIPEFVWGHYDLTIDSMYEQLQKVG